MTNRLKGFMLIFSIIEIVALAISLSVFWGWFLAPLGLPKIEFTHAVGLLAIWILLRTTKSKDIDALKEIEADFEQSFKHVRDAFSESMSKFIVAWAFALIAHFFG